MSPTVVRGEQRRARVRRRAIIADRRLERARREARRDKVSSTSAN